MKTAIAHSNIALVKYWGKRDQRLNLPAAGSLSLALGDLTTQTTARVIESDTDQLELDGEPAKPAVLRRVSEFLELVRQRAGTTARLAIASSNNFPTAAGLASSASGFAALALAASAELGLKLEPRELSELARRGSGSAARSIPGGWALMHCGESEDGRDAVAEQIAPPTHWDLRCVVLVTTRGEKAIGSTEGMNRTMKTSAFYQPWIDSVANDLERARSAVAARDFEKLGDVAEASCLRMHASAIAARPGVLYWNGSTVELIHRVRAARANGIPVFFTIDAGPHVKVFCPPSALDAVAALASDHALETIVSAPGGAARLMEAV